MDKRFLLIIFLGMGANGFTQTGNLHAGWDYWFYPTSEEYTTISKTVLYGNFFSRFNQLRLEHGLQFEMDLVDLPVEYWTGNNSSTTLYEFSYGVNLSYPISEMAELHLKVKPVFSGTFEHKFSSEDVFLYGGIFALLRGEIAAKPSFIKIGMAYSHDLGEPELLPFIQFSATVSDRLSFKAGFPESEITFRLRPESTLVARLSYQGKYGNLGSASIQGEEYSAAKLKWEWSSLGVNYTHDLSPILSMNFGAGYLLKNQFSLRNEDEKTISTIDLDSYPFLSSGIELKFN